MHLAYQAFQIKWKEPHPYLFTWSSKLIKFWKLDEVFENDACMTASNFRRIYASRYQTGRTVSLRIVLSKLYARVLKLIKSSLSNERKQWIEIVLHQVYVFLRSMRNIENFYGEHDIGRDNAKSHLQRSHHTVVMEANSLFPSEHNSFPLNAPQIAYRTRDMLSYRL